MSEYPIVKCPTCKQRGDWFAEKYGPFCSNRCKLLDLGQWFDEEQKISGPLRPEHIVDMSDEEMDQLIEGGGMELSESED
ncbi:MAG: endogenous inhibitor of DNA gyrase (YacG/DUF329 family) [Limisphaerales bacterium]|jgi:endogenous inhibitor of DNA gyrase (YacG/DUF329 family)